MTETLTRLVSSWWPQFGLVLRAKDGALRLLFGYWDEVMDEVFND